MVLDRHSQISNTYYHILAYAFSALCASMHCMIKMKCKTNYDSRLLSKVMKVKSYTFGDPFIHKARKNHHPLWSLNALWFCQEMGMMLVNKAILAKQFQGLKGSNIMTGQYFGIFSIWLKFKVKWKSHWPTRIRCVTGNGGNPGSKGTRWIIGRIREKWFVYG